MKRNDSRSVPLPDDAALRLPNTANGKAWLGQFNDEDLELAARLLGALTLVSHSALVRALSKLVIDEAMKIDGPVALYATRETDAGDDYFQAHANPDKPLSPLDAAPRGADLGSEVLIGNMIRNLAKQYPGKLLNHPSLEMLRKERARAIFVVDDFIGSGKRTSEFIGAMWHSASITSWHSRHQIRFAAIAYSGTLPGMAKVRGLKSSPQISIFRDCPTLDQMPWRQATKDAVIALCEGYGQRTSRRSMRLGFGNIMATIVFEHGCPNNAPAILWAPESPKTDWRPLFPQRAVPLEQASAFPADILQRDPIVLLTDLGDGAEELIPAVSGAPPLGRMTTTVLALVASGVRSRAALSYATGYDRRSCTDLIDACVSRGYLTPTLRITAKGRQELKAAPHPGRKKLWVPPEGEDTYYPRQLRGPHRG